MLTLITNHGFGFKKKKRVYAASRMVLCYIVSLLDVAIVSQYKLNSHV